MRPRPVGWIRVHGPVAFVHAPKRVPNNQHETLKGKRRSTPEFEAVLQATWQMAGWTCFSIDMLGQFLHFLGVIVPAEETNVKASGQLSLLEA